VSRLSVSLRSALVLPHLSHSPMQRVTTMGLFGLGLPEVAVVAGIAVLVFGEPPPPSPSSSFPLSHNEGYGLSLP